jgi:radical SAM/Cys-rich protein
MVENKNGGWEVNTFLNVLEKHNVDYKNSLRRGELTTLQVNVGNLCNQSCSHCHVDAGPNGKNIMSKKVVDNILKILSEYKIETLDITGGAPELNPNFDYLIRSARPLVSEIIVRSNMTVFFEPGKDYLPNFFKENKIHLICSLPCYTKENVDSQRGNGVFEKSIKAMRILNDLGFANGDGLKLDLVHNPNGPFLPTGQAELETDYKHFLKKHHGVTFNRLIALTNVPVNRFKNYLKNNGEYEKYIYLLEKKFNAVVLENIMCRNLLSVGWDGRLYDCDFNQAMGLALKDGKEEDITIGTIDLNGLRGGEIYFNEHCLSCTAGSGSSCQGALRTDAGGTIRDGVKYFYQGAAKQPKKELCCPVSYEKEDVSYIPEEVLEVSYGCGSPISLANPMQGEVVVDLGCGAGIDCFIAAKKVGVMGRVIGIDMTEEMLTKANKALEHVADVLRFLNLEFRKGFLEDVPVESESVDLVTSNCVLNLSPDKSMVFAEIYRVLKDGGRFVISDIIADKEPPAYMKNNKELWGECISGALTQMEFLSRAKESGFYGLEILKNLKYREVDGIQFCSITVRGYKFKKGRDCVYIGQYATYPGPYSEVRDDDNHIFPRGVPIEVCTDTANKLIRKPYTGQFIITDVDKDGGPSPCCSSENKGKSCC